MSASAQISLLVFQSLVQCRREGEKQQLVDPDKVVEEILDVVEQINHLHNKFKEAPQQPHCQPLSALMDRHLNEKNTSDHGKKGGDGELGQERGAGGRGDEGQPGQEGT